MTAANRARICIVLAALLIGLMAYVVGSPFRTPDEQRALQAKQAAWDRMDACIRKAIKEHPSMFSEEYMADEQKCRDDYYGVRK